MMSLWDALRMNMMIAYQELVRTFPMAERTYPGGTKFLLVASRTTDDHCNNDGW